MHYQFKNKQEVLNTAFAKGYKLAEANQSELVHLTIHPEGLIPAHALPIHVTFFVIIGKGQLAIDNKTVLVEAGDVIEVFPNKQREWKNSGKNDLVLLVIKSI